MEQLTAVTPVATRWCPIPTNDKKDNTRFSIPPPTPHTLKSISYTHLAIYLGLLDVPTDIFILYFYYTFKSCRSNQKSPYQIAYLKKNLQFFSFLCGNMWLLLEGWKIGKALIIDGFLRWAEELVVGEIHSCSFGFHSTAPGWDAAFFHTWAWQTFFFVS